MQTGKPEIVHFLSLFSSSSTIRGININGINISPSSDARNLGVTVDSHLQMTKHVNNISKSAFLAIRNIGRIRKYLDSENCERLVHAFVISKLDSCNSLLVGLPNSEIEKLQRVQNCAARLVMGAKRGEHITPILYHLQWLPIRCRIDFKILLMTYKALNCQALSYITELLLIKTLIQHTYNAKKNFVVLFKTNFPAFPSYSAFLGITVKGLKLNQYKNIKVKQLPPPPYVW